MPSPKQILEAALAQPEVQEFLITYGLPGKEQRLDRVRACTMERAIDTIQRAHGGDAAILKAELIFG